MNIKSLRQHYFKRGNKWIPKRGFSSPDYAYKSIEDTGEITLDLDVYLCGICGEYHKGRPKNRAVA